MSQSMKASSLLQIFCMVTVFVLHFGLGAKKFNVGDLAYNKCFTWDDNETTLKLTCRLQRLSSNVIFYHEKNNTYVTCHMRNDSLVCDPENKNIYQFREGNQITLMLTVSKLRKDLSGDWFCQTGEGDILKTEVDLLKGIVDDLWVKIRGTVIGKRTTVIECSSCREPNGKFTEIWIDGKSNNSIWLNATGECLLGKESLCHPKECNCSKSGNMFQKSYIGLEIGTNITCSMYFSDSYREGVYHVAASANYNNTDFNVTATQLLETIRQPEYKTTLEPQHKDDDVNATAEQTTTYYNSTNQGEEESDTAVTGYIILSIGVICIAPAFMICKLCKRKQKTTFISENDDFFTEERLISYGKGHKIPSLQTTVMKSEMDPLIETTNTSKKDDSSSEESFLSHGNVQGLQGVKVDVHLISSMYTKGTDGCKNGNISSISNLNGKGEADNNMNDNVDVSKTADLGKSVYECREINGTEVSSCPPQEEDDFSQDIDQSLRVIGEMQSSFDESDDNELNMAHLLGKKCSSIQKVADDYIVDKDDKEKIPDLSKFSDESRKIDESDADYKIEDNAGQSKTTDLVISPDENRKMNGTGSDGYGDCDRISDAEEDLDENKESTFQDISEISSDTADDHYASKTPINEGAWSEEIKYGSFPRKKKEKSDSLNVDDNQRAETENQGDSIDYRSECEDIKSSDEEIPLVCKICENKKISTNDDYCLDCGIRLCSRCSEQHTKISATKKHKRIPIENIPNGFSGSTLCEYHLEDNIIYYCSNHKTVICRLCSDKEHTQCKKVAIEEIAQTNISRYLEERESTFHNYKQALDDLLLKLRMNQGVTGVVDEFLDCHNDVQIQDDETKSTPETNPNTDQIAKLDSLSMQIDSLKLVCSALDEEEAYTHGFILINKLLQKLKEIPIHEDLKESSKTPDKPFFDLT